MTTLGLEQNLLSLYESGKNDYEVAAIVHLGRNSLRQWRKDHGIPSQSKKKGLTSDLCPKILEELVSGRSLTSISEGLGVKRTSISKLLKRHEYFYDVRRRTRPFTITTYKLTSLQESILVGDLFGDGGLVSAGPETAYYQCGHCLDQKEFVDWKYSIFSPLSCRTRTNRRLDKRSGVQNDVVTMATWSNNSFKGWFDLFYPSGKGDKILTADMVRFLNWQSLAVWFMGDGTRNRNRIHFVVGRQIDLLPIIDALNDKFGDMFEARCYAREWHLNIINPRRFIQETSQYILPCFQYKIPDKFTVPL